ncbi:alpha/beta fold hydrolase [Ramlibacter sp.]|uniref:alpha/beta fold hydrolase n=1 Tax=Ramlibacter sp. TaxID=1917967 RepID=UPI0035B38DDC
MNAPAPSGLPPLAGELPPEALRVLAAAQALRTPADGGELVWHAWGEGRPLVLLHGGSGSWTHWLRNVQALADAGRRVLVPDLPGFGDSARLPGVQDADGIAGPLAQALQQLVGDTPCDVVGFSFGGLTAGLMAAQAPQRVARLVLVGAPALIQRDARLALRGWRGLPAQAATEAHRHNLRVLMLHDPAAADDLAVALQAANTARDRMLRRKLALTDILARTLPALACPVHGLWGEHDALYVGHLDVVRATLQAAPAFGRFEVIEGAGHWVQFEQPQAFNERLLGLLAL